MSFKNLSKSEKEMVRDLVEVLWWQEVNYQPPLYTEKEIMKKFNLKRGTITALKAHVARNALKK